MTGTTHTELATEEEEFARLTLREMGPLGDTLAELDGESVNVFGGIPGEEVVCRIVRYRRKRRRYVSGFVTQVLKPSPHRVDPPCVYFGACTGCQWQHIDYPHQLTLKRDTVVRELGRYAELEHLTVSPTVSGPQLFGYRNHARFTVRRQGSLGFVNRITRRFVKVDECMLMAPWINETLRGLQGRCETTSQLSIRYGINTGEWLIQPAISPSEIPFESGQTHYREKLLDRTFRVASPSFFQVNTEQAERLVAMVGERMELAGNETLLDAYAGVGTFAVLLAPQVQRVIAIEESEAAVKDAAINTLGIDNLEFRQGRVEDVLAELDGEAHAVVLDPPRAGCHPAALEAVVRWAPRRVCYVSCDPETLARDLQVLVRGGLCVESVEPVDMFPHTHHVECVVTLSSAGNAAHRNSPQSAQNN
jgi:23S rRNA (uracil1939-C5)-methyltransferase